MSKQTPGSILLLAIACTFGPTATAADHALDFKLVVKPLEVKGLEAPNVEGQVVFLNKMYGVAAFKDGRTASKEFICSGDYNKGSGPFVDYRTYPIHGEYTVVSGTGVYAGAKGSGSFDGMPHKFTGGVNLFSGKFAISTP